MNSESSSTSFARYPSLQGQVVFVTGGGSGIGAAIVEAFAAQGARVAFVDILKAESEALAERLGGGAARPLFIQCDLLDIAALRAAIAAVRERLGPIGVLVNNAANDYAPRFRRGQRGRLGPRDGPQSQASVLRRPGRSPADARDRRRVDRQFLIGRLDARAGADVPLCDGEGGHRRLDQHPGAGIRRRQYPRQCDRAGSGQHGAPTAPVGQRKRSARVCRAPVPSIAFCCPRTSRARLCFWAPPTAR